MKDGDLKERRVRATAQTETRPYWIRRADSENAIQGQVGL